MRGLLSWLSTTLVFALIGWFANTAYHLPQNSNLIASVKPTPLYKYAIENLSKAHFEPGKIEFGKIIKNTPKYTSYEFSMEFNPDFTDTLKKTSGVINIPSAEGKFPVVAMFRGYVDQKTYVTRQGTQRVGEVLAENGFVTIAPDFLGYGNSDIEASDIFEARFQTYVTSAVLIKSINSLPVWDQKNIFVWGHSNGGQIALTLLEITGVDYPAVLWAPVGKPFPFSILAYTDESDDHGKYIRSELSKFEETYDAEKFSLENYFSQIKAPISLLQGTNDDAVPFYWSDSLAKILKENGAEIAYTKYPGADHNLQPSWNRAVLTTLSFFNKMRK
jgi:dipeptidyl aminopeptidase/acylaminoacyl peptidase